MGDRYFLIRDNITGYFVDSRTSTSRQESRGTAPKIDAKTGFVQGTSVSSGSLYSKSSARATVKKYSLKP